MLNYSQSKKILEKIKQANKILLNCHVNPDLDSIGSATAMFQALKKMGKQVEVICPSKISPKFGFIKYSSKIKTVDFNTFDFSLFDLFLILDTSGETRVTGVNSAILPKDIEKVVIDHHINNPFGKYLSIIDEGACATTQILCQIFEDWGVELDSDIAMSLYCGIAGDTVLFKYLQDPESVFALAHSLISAGANHRKLVLNVYNNYDHCELGMLGEFLKYMKFDKKAKFVWSAIPYKIFEQYGKPGAIKEITADMFFQSIKGTDLGVVMLEIEPDTVTVSFRSKDKIDVSKLAISLGGGGHKNAAGATIYDKYDRAVKKVLGVVIQFSKTTYQSK